MNRIAPHIPAIVLAGTLCLGGYARAERYALLTAVEDYSRVPGARSLPGCRGDLADFKAVLIRDLKFPEAHIQTLEDTAATKAAILGALRELVAKAGPEDSVVFYWSGHGGQVPDLNDDDESEDGLDETLITVDFDPLDPDTWLLDDHLRAALSRLRTPRALVLIDACHAGTGTRGDIVNKRADFGFAPMLGRGRKDGQLLEVTKAGEGSHVLLAACAAEQVAAMGEYGGKRRSLFTSALVCVLPNLLASQLPDVNVAVQAEMVRLHPEAARSQHSQLESRATCTLNVLIGEGALAISTTHTPAPVSVPLPEPVDGLPSAFPVKVTTDRNSYRGGETMVATVVSEQTGYLRLYYVDKAGDATLIFPNFHQKDNRIAGRARVEVGGPASPFLFRIKEPLGTEMLLAAVSPGQFTDHDALRPSKEAPVMPMGKVDSIRKLLDRGTKQIVVESQPGTGTLTSPVRPAQIGRAACMYQIVSNASL